MTNVNVMTTPRGRRRSRVWVCLTYSMQGLIGAAVSTTLPGLSVRENIGVATISLLVLLIGIVAGFGSLLAGWWARDHGSHTLILPGLLLQALAVTCILWNLPLPFLFVVFGVYGAGIGVVDAGNGMQSITVQAMYGKSIMNLFFAFQTLASIAGALLVAAVTGAGSPFNVALMVVIALAVGIALTARRGLAQDPEPALLAARPTVASTPLKLPWRGILVFGLAIGVVYIGDSAITTWSSIYLSQDLRSAAAIAPLGFAAYQTLVLVSRLFGDHAVRRIGRARVVTLGATLGAAGFLIVALSRAAIPVVIGFAIVGIGLGVIIPLSFAVAGELAPDRVDEVVARLNVFNYLGVIVGSVSVGLIASGLSLTAAFIFPAVLIIPIFFTIRAYRREAPRPMTTATLTVS